MSAGVWAAITVIYFVFYLLASPYRQTCYLFTPLGDLRWNVNVTVRVISWVGGLDQRPSRPVLEKQMWTRSKNMSTLRLREHDHRHMMMAASHISVSNDFPPQNGLSPMQYCQVSWIFSEVYHVPGMRKG